MNGALRRLKTRRQPFVRAVPDVVTERDGLKIWATAFSGNNECPKQGWLHRLSFKTRKPGAVTILSLSECLPVSIICPPHVGEGCAAAATWPPRVRLDQLLMAMRLTCDCASSVFGKVIVSI
ncbi:MULTISPECIES: hypothetical protein, partial [unclassified Rhizobium]|uniref:hypothetical protein n=1 Tax=unclassified Rhizobium TaxID=2613769 RepID=UPI001FEE69FF